MSVPMEAYCIKLGSGVAHSDIKNGQLPSGGSSSTEMDMESMIKQMDSLDFITSKGRKDVVRKPPSLSLSLIVCIHWHWCGGMGGPFS